MHSWPSALHFLAKFERSPFLGFSSFSVNACVLCVERLPFSGFCSHHFLEEDDLLCMEFSPSLGFRSLLEFPLLRGFRSLLEFPPLRGFRSVLESPPLIGFRSFWFETCVSFVLDSGVPWVPSSGCSPATSKTCMSDVLLDLLCHLRELSITYRNTRIAICIYCA